MKKIALGLVILIMANQFFAENIELTKSDYIALIVSNYVHGFKEFDTSITSFEDSVSIGIYYDDSTQSEARANQLATRLRTQVKAQLGRYDWALGVKVIVNVYSEDRSGRGY